MRRLPVWIAILLAAPAAHAEWSWFGSSKKTERSTATTEARVKAPRAHHAVTTSIVVAPSLVVADGAAAPGVVGHISVPVLSGTPLYFTGDFGTYFRSYYVYSTGVAFATLLGMDYKFDLPRTRIRPLFGVTLGPVFGRRVVFAMLFRPGVDFPIAKNVELNVETRFGVVASDFVFVPQFGVRFLL